MKKKEMKALISVRVVLENEILEDGVLLWEKDRILAVGKRGEVAIPSDAEVIDGKGQYVGPGFVDLHVHGGNGALFHEDPVTAAKHFLSHGETTVLAGFFYEMSREEFLRGISLVKAAMKEKTAPNLAGFYMEGPYLNPKYGSGHVDLAFRDEIRREDYLPIVEAAGRDAVVWAIAPEREGIETFLQDVKRVNPQGVIAVAHSEATPDEIRSLKHYGIRLMTHCMDATGRRKGTGGTRTCGPDEECLMSPEMTAELICDSLAVHVPRDLMELIFFVKGWDGVALISDGFVSEEENPPEFSHVKDLCFGKRGELSGSKLTMDVALCNLVRHMKCTLPQAFRAASLNPARAVGWEESIGSIAVGKKANFVLLREDLTLNGVIFEGEFSQKWDA